MSIAIVGAPGAGKTSVGRELAALLGKDFVDVDQRIEEVVGKPIRHIFAEDGEPYFRALEESATLELLARDAVVALGGGAVMNQAIRDALKDHDVIWLDVTISRAARRAGMNTVRPLLLGNVRGRLIELMRERTPYYQAVATDKVESDDRTPREIARELADARRKP